MRRRRERTVSGFPGGGKAVRQGGPCGRPPSLSFISTAVYLLLPPTGLAWLALLALLLPRRLRPRRLAALLLVPLVLLSMPAVSVPLLAALEVPPAEAAADGPEPGAIVILSAEIERTANPAAPDIGALTLERERAGAALQRATGLPVLVTGGVLGTPPAVAVLMARSLAADFLVPVRWVEARAGTTWENAQFSAPILRQAGISRVYLVTHAWHMRRSILAFRRAGIEAVPVPVRTLPQQHLGADDLMPSLSAWVRSYYAVHEWIGLLFYGLRR